MPEIDVRPYDPADRAELLGVVFEAAGEGAPGSEVWGHHASLADVYLTPYLDLEPDSVFVVTADGRPVGYLAGCVDDARFPSEGERLKSVIQKYRLYRMPGPRRFFVRAAYDTALFKVRRIPTAGELKDPRWPSHLHIDVMPVARGTGAAARLMELWFERLREVGSPGCYLQTSAENQRAVRFFESVGFRRHGANHVVPGSRYDGRRMHQQDMVREV
ncbi:GNAT family N-acetyltransferase [Nocardioides sp. MAH-18]|uniref:GNAT family N-acetyltransferase n=1 Tax=Nocardioides agri TaxID=2682843 RepID=A0A6L6XRQ1_9ACTN|nr:MULTISPECIES: GNAT family N-acetyltransferase [unclassified Nocardioides]MBA2955006.1 GNAT family N-acetyltransferase [Nocardioides sp. CGMCC 1.13656]MVQ49860.1 GNAT family N-acetyltransferase [Nocardioides sp. MAH-18]